MYVLVTKVAMASQHTGREAKGEGELKGRNGNEGCDGIATYGMGGERIFEVPENEGCRMTVAWAPNAACGNGKRRTRGLPSPQPGIAIAARGVFCPRTRGHLSHSSPI